MVHLVSPPGTDQWRIKSYDFSWLDGMTLMKARVHAEPNGWESLEFDSTDAAVKFVMSKPIPRDVPKGQIIAQG